MYTGIIQWVFATDSKKPGGLLKGFCTKARDFKQLFTVFEQTILLTKFNHVTRYSFIQARNT